MSDHIPIYRRHRNRFTPYVYECSQEDFQIGSDILYPANDDPYFAKYGRLKSYGYPQICFVGDSNVVHLKRASTDRHLPQRVWDFLKPASYVGVGGLTWWKCENELHGKFSSRDKFRRYGYQWRDFDCGKYHPAYFIIMVVI